MDSNTGTLCAPPLWRLDKFRQLYLQIQRLWVLFLALGQRELKKWPWCWSCTSTGNKYWAHQETEGLHCCRELWCSCPGARLNAHWLHGKFTHGAGNSQQKGHYNHTQLHAFPCWSLAKWPPCCGHVLTSMSLQPWAQLLVFWMEVSRWGFSIIFPPPFTCIPFIPSYCSSPHLKGSTDLPWRMTSGLKQPLSWQSAFGRARHPQLKQRETKASKLEDVTNAAQSTADPRRYQI